MKARLLSICFLLYLFGAALAQQHAGSSYFNSKPTVNGAEITFWNLTNPRGQTTSMLNYMIAPNGKRQDPSKVRRAVIVIHGLQRDPELYMSNILSALALTTRSHPDVNAETVAIVAPYFASGDDKNIGYPWTANPTTGRNFSSSMATVWQGSRWASGDVNQYPTTRLDISSYAVVDQMIQYFDNKSVYPNLKQIVIAGHSLGAQFVNRYAAVQNTLATASPVSFWVGNPNSWLWLNSSRPIPDSACSTYDNWRDGLANYYPIYNKAFVAEPTNVLRNWNTKAVTLARALQDFGNDDSTCAPGTTGSNRGERFFNMLNWFPPSSVKNVDYVPDVGHSAGAMFASTAGQTRLFLDNFNGDGSRHLDFGPRQQANDSPNPDPANAPPPSIRGTGAAGMKYQGCFTDSVGSRALMYTAWQGNGSNTVESCTAACAAANYAIAGMEYGNECYCGNGMGSKTLQQGDSSCSMPCAGNNVQTCGAGSRISVWSASTPVIYDEPATVASVSTFNSIGCYTEATSGRALSAKETRSGSMTVESCASFCSGYQYMGLEYSSECFCGNLLGAGSAPAAAQSDCSMTCSGNQYQLCGAGSRLTMYNNTAVISSTSTTSSSTSSSTVVSSTATSTAATISSSSTPSTATSASSSSVSTAPTPSSSPEGYKGCYAEPSGGVRALPHAGAGGASNTVASCRASCTRLGYPVAGLEYGVECWCGSQLAAGAALKSDSECSMPCAGDSTQKCGAGYRLSVYTSLDTLPTAPVPSSPATVSGFTSLGCHADSTSRRTFPVRMAGDNLEACASSCSNYEFFGMEYASECYCGNTLTAAKIADSSCNMGCASKSNELCGGPDALNVYRKSTASTSFSSSASVSTSTSSSAPVSISTTESSTSTSTSATSTVSSSTSLSTSSTAAPSPTLLAGTRSLGCYADNVVRRSLSVAAYSNSHNTPSSCASACRERGYKFCGTEYSNECYCGNFLLHDASPSNGAVRDGCSMPCSGDSRQICGGSSRLSVVQDDQWTQTFFTVTRTGQWSFSDCIVDSGSQRALPTSLTVSGNTPEKCLAACLAANLPYCGMEYSGECYGSMTAPTTDSAPSTGSSDPLTRGCNMPCAGNSTVACGGPNRLNFYTYLGNDAPVVSPSVLQ